MKKKSKKQQGINYAATVQCWLNVFGYEGTKVLVKSDKKYQKVLEELEDV